MAFKTLKSYNEERFGDFFLLRNDGDSADVIFLYRSLDDVLLADTHYIKSAKYNGYVHCCGAGCPACGKGIRVQNKLFIPVYNVDAGEVQFFDRNIRFENQLENDVFSKFANPSEYVFKIIRHGAAGSIDTTYEIIAVGRVTGTPYESIVAKLLTTFPDRYSVVCKEYTPDELSSMLNNNTSNYNSDVASMPAYTVTPRPVPTSFESPVYAGDDLDDDSENTLSELDDDDVNF